MLNNQNNKIVETYYVNGKSKKEINERIANGENVYAQCLNFFNPHTLNITKIANGSVIKVFEKYVSGSPYAKSYGTWNGKIIK